MSDELTAEQIAIANLAAQFLPKIELPHDWQTMPLHELNRAVQAPTDASVRDGKLPLAHPFKEKPITAFEVLTEEAVRRTRILLDAAVGKRRAYRVARKEALNWLDESAEEDRLEGIRREAECEKWGQAFDRETAKRDKATLTGAEMLQVVLPKCSDENRQRYWLAWLRGRDQEAEQGNVEFPEEPKPDFELIGMTEFLDRTWGRSDFASFARSLRRFYADHGEAIRKQHLREHPACIEGGETTAKRAKESQATDAARYGSKVDTDVASILAEVPDGKLNKAVKKHLPKKAAKRKSAKSRG